MTPEFKSEEIKRYIADHTEELYELHKTLCLIPAPSHHEEKRAAFCKAWFDENCGEGAYIDEAKNVIFPYSMTDGCRISVFSPTLTFMVPLMTRSNSWPAWVVVWMGWFCSSSE